MKTRRRNICAALTPVLEQYFAQYKDNPLPHDIYHIFIDAVEKQLLTSTLEHVGYNRTHAAKVLGLSRTTVLRKIEHHQIPLLKKSAQSSRTAPTQKRR